MAAYNYVFRMLSVVLWKFWRIRQHRKWQTFIEIAAPVLLVLLLVAVKAVMRPDIPNGLSETDKPTIFPPKELRDLVLHLCTIGCTGKIGSQWIHSYLAYSPNDPFTNKLMKIVEQTLHANGVGIDVQGFEEEEQVEALNALVARNITGYFGHPSSITGGVVFLSKPGKDSDLIYKIRLSTPKFVTGKVFPDIELPGPEKQFEVYEKTGFLGLQMLIDQAFIKLAGEFTIDYDIATQAFPYPPYEAQDKSEYTMILSILVPAAIIMGFTYLICNVMHGISIEKKTGIRKYLKMLGLGNTGYWFGWFLDNFIVSLIVITLLQVVLHSDVFGEGAVIQHSAKSIIFLFLFLYIVAALWFCYFVTTLISSSHCAPSLGAIIWLGSLIIPACLVGSGQRYLATQILMALFPNMCLFWGFRIIATWESRVVGVQWDNLEDYPNVTDSLNLALVISMLVFNAMFYMILTAFLHHTEPTTRRLKSPYRLLYDVLYDDTKFPEFIHFLSHFKHKKRKRIDNSRTPGMDVPFDSPVGILRTKVLERLGLLDMTEKGDTVSSVFSENLVEIPDETVSVQCGVKLRNVTKCYHTRTVLRRITCDFHRGEVSFIVGKNGGGKTTLVEIILGIVKADEGSVYVNEYDIHEYPMDVRRSIGLCPQTDMFFPELSVMEHLLLYSYLKGEDWNQAVAQGKQICNIFQLTKHSKTKANRLPKRQQRMLSLAIALMGDPKIIIFDEPTNNMDAESAKIFWNYVMRIKEDKTIIVTSNSLSEAAQWADRIAIINDGKLRCHGTPEYLHKVFGDGYTVKISVSVESAEKVARMISKEVQFAEIKNRTMTTNGEDILLIVPNRYSTVFPELFTKLYNVKEHFKISTVSVDYVSVDEAFYSSNEMFDSKNLRDSGSFDDFSVTTSQATSFFYGEKVPGTGCQLMWSRFCILVKKHHWITKANAGAYIFFQFILPLALILAGVIGANRGIRNKDLSKYGRVNFGIRDFNDPVTFHTMDDTGLEMAYAETVGPSAKSTKHRHEFDVYDAVLDIGVNDPSKYRHSLIAGAMQKETHIVALYSSVPYVAPPLSLNLVTNTLLKMSRPRSLKKLKIVVENHPLPNGSYESIASNGGNEVGKAMVIKSFCFYFGFALALFCAVVLVKPINERYFGSLHLQLMTGVNPVTFWLSYLFYDGIFVVLFSSVAIFFVFVSQEQYLFTKDGAAGALFLILFLGGLASTTFAYAFSKLKTGGAAFGLLNLFHILAVTGSYMIYYNRDGISNEWAELFFWLSTPFPVPFTVHALFVYSRIAIENSRCDVISEHILHAVCAKTGLYVYFPPYSCCSNCTHDKCWTSMSYFRTGIGSDSYTVLRDLVILLITSVLYLIIVIMSDNNIFRKINRYFLSAPSEVFNVERGNKDPSAAQEAEWVRKLVGMGTKIPEDEGLLVDGLCQNYGTIGAFSHISFAVKRGQCFGLLGLHGAGKSSIFKSLVGQELPANGDAFISPYSMLGSPREFAECIGFCPQDDALHELLTVRETMHLFGTLRGICKGDLESEITQWISALGLENHSNRLVQRLSHSSKRKLSVAIALLGNPDILVLDEPTRDIDPVGTKQIWNIFHKQKQEGKIILLASPGIKECENLCTRIGLVMAGHLHYVGTTHDIKSKFLNGYTVSLKLTKRFSIDDESELDAMLDIKENIEKILVDFVFRDVAQNSLIYLIPQRGQNWGSIFEKLEKIRTSMPESFQYYTMKESTLEEVFNAMEELEMDLTNELPGAKVSCVQRVCMGRCISDDYS